MLNDQRAITPTNRDHEEDDRIRDIHALTPPLPRPPSATRPRRREAWETISHQSSSLSTASEATSSENFTTMSREFNALVLAGSTIGNMGSENDRSLNRIGEEEDTNPLAIVPDNSPLGLFHSPTPPTHGNITSGGGGEVSVQSVKKEEVEAKINAWQTAKISKINNRFKRDDAVINGWESEEVQKATSWMKKVERKLEEKRAKAVEKMQNDVAKARRKAEEKRASAEAKRGTKVAKVMEIAKLMRAVGRPPVKRSFF